MASFIPNALRDLVSELPLPGSLAARVVADDVKDALARAPLALNEYGYDPYGFSSETAGRLMLPAAGSEHVVVGFRPGTLLQ